MIKKIFLFLFVLTGILQFIQAVKADETEQQLSRTDIVNIVIKQNQDLLAAEKHINVAEAVLIQAGAVNNISGILESESLTPSNIINNENMVFNAGLSYDFTLGNQMDLKRQIAGYGIDIARLEFQDKVREKVFNAKQSYDELIYRYRLIDIKEEYIRNAKETYEATNKQYKAGEIAKYDVYRAELEKNYAEQLLEARKREAKTTQLQLNFLLNRTTEKIKPKDPFISRVYNSINLEDLTKKALENNPQLKILELKMKSEEINFQLTKVMIFPSVNAELTGGNEGINAKVEFPLPFLYRQEGETAISQATGELLKNQYQAVKKEVLFNVNTAYQELVLSVDAVKAYQTSVINQSESLRILAIKRLQTGEGSILEVLDAGRTLNQSEDELAHLIFEARKNYNYLEFVVGGNSLDKNI